MVSVKRLLIIGCKRTMDEICVGCSRCLVAFNRCDGQFIRYRNQEVELMGLLSCGNCPGATLIPRLALLKVQMNSTLWIDPLGEEPTTIHLAPCLVNCPHSESIIGRMKAKCKAEIVRGTHSYQMETIF